MKEKARRSHRVMATVLALLLCLALPTCAAGDAAAQRVGRKVVPLGRAVGMKLFSDGVLVVGLSDLPGAQGGGSPGRSCGLRTGDVITHINGQEVDSIEAVQTILRSEGDRPLTLLAERGGQSLQLAAQAVPNERGDYQLGVWLRDSMAGIGTLTFYDPDSGVYAALGHGICDVDTAQLMPLESGALMYAEVAEVSPGASGAPGELHGSFDVARELGTLTANTPQGVYGSLLDETLPEHAAVELAAREQVHVGPAEILANVSGDEVRAYAVEITHVYPPAREEDRNLMLRVTDPDLLAQTGGIVQGMSGSPILQDGRLVGAVTHVLVNDPTKGYGILAERMIRAADAAAGRQ